ncbi:TPA: hypothetical protein PMB05_003624 [Vibrio cholerae]|nr:hypothetical protein [Vibrio cholerae]
MLGQNPTYRSLLQLAQIGKSLTVCLVKSSQTQHLLTTLLNPNLNLLEVTLKSLIDVNFLDGDAFCGDSLVVSSIISPEFRDRIIAPAIITIMGSKAGALKTNASKTHMADKE